MTTHRTIRRHFHEMLSRPPRCADGFSMLELIVVVAAIVILAAAVSPRLFTWIDEGRRVRAQNDVAAVAAALTRFYQDTKRWPGQAELLPSGTMRYLTIGHPSNAQFPSLAGLVGIGAGTCVGGLLGVKAGDTFTAVEPSPFNSRDLLDYLSKPPSATNYPNWRGPYLSQDMALDPWGSAFVISVIPLFCDESVEEGAPPGGKLGYGWVLSAGPNRTLQTKVTANQLGGETDDVGVSLGKRMVRSTAP